MGGPLEQGQDPGFEPPGGTQLCRPLHVSPARPMAAAVCVWLRATRCTVCAAAASRSQCALPPAPGHFKSPWTLSGNAGSLCKHTCRTGPTAYPARGRRERLLHAGRCAEPCLSWLYLYLRHGGRDSQINASLQTPLGLRPVSPIRTSGRHPNLCVPQSTVLVTLNRPVFHRPPTSREQILPFQARRLSTPKLTPRHPSLSPPHGPSVLLLSCLKTSRL